MKEVEWQAVITLKVTLNDEPLGVMESTYEGMVKIKTFIRELIKHPTAMHAYYRSLFMDEFIDNSADQLQVLAQLLNYLPDYGPLFVQIAQNCSPEVATFIEYLFSEDTDDKEANVRKEMERRILEDELRQLKVSAATFTLQ